MTGRHIFLDRDGVLNAYLHDDYIKTPAEFRFLPGAVEAIRQLTDAEYQIIIVSNQAGVGRGLMDRAALDAVTAHMLNGIHQAGGKILDIFYCTHGPRDGCDCRKPKPGLLLNAARKHAVELAATFLIGDNQADVQAAQAAGCRSILVLSGRSRAEEVAGWAVQPGRIEKNISEAVRTVLA
ncbi:HAD family hydrolase [bacterium]|nr:HAD family hydrolase [bacterium]